MDDSLSSLINDKYKLDDAKKKILIKEFAGSALIHYSKETNTEISFSNGLNGSLKYTPFMEFLYPIQGDDYYVYNSSLTDNQCSTVLKKELIIPDEVTVNEKNRLMMDMDMNCYYTASQIDYPVYQNYPFVRNPSIEVQCRFLATLKQSANGFYTENEIYRWNTFLYYPGTLIYLLISQDPYKIYVLQVFTNKANPDITSDQLIYLNNYIELPDKWTFAYMKLENDTFLSVPANGKALVINDSIYNAYMYIYPEAAPWLYAKYK